MSEFFNEAEVKKAENLLTILAEQSARFWANSFISDDFLYHGEVVYRSSSFYLGDGWSDRPNKEHEPPSAKQILKFMEVYLDEARKKIDWCLQRDTEVAMILRLEKRMPDEYWGGTLNKFFFGGWDNDPFGEVAKAKKAAELVGAMSHESGYRKTTIELCKGKIYRCRYGSREQIAVVDI